MHFRQTSVLIGPNNAGKSTIIAALRLCAALLSEAKRHKLETPIHDLTRDRHVRGQEIRPDRMQFSDENIRHEFHVKEARLELQMKNKAMMYVVWPIDGQPYFYLEHIAGMQPGTVRVVKENYGSIGIVPTLSPIESTEVLLSADYVKSRISTAHLASRHFRNQLHMIRRENPEEFEQLRAFIIDNTPELSSLDLTIGASNLDLFYRESSSRTEREMCWSGDGIQIWVQILLHVWRQRETNTLVLDEPDVFLHPDLQRRLIRVLEEVPAQVVLATHAPEILAEASRDSVIIVDRNRTRSRRISDERVLSELNDSLGSGFNLKLARALRSRVALFVEGQDIKILKNTAKAVGAKAFHSERGLTVASMGGASNAGLAHSFGWLNNNLLEDAVEVHVLLDRDYMSDEMVHDLTEQFVAEKVLCHVWRRKELESYLLSPELIARVSGAPLTFVESALASASESLKLRVLSRYLDVRSKAEVTAQRHAVTVSEHYMQVFDRLWADADWALYACPAKDILSLVNSGLQSAGYSAVSARGLSSRIRSTEVPAEMRDFILKIETQLSLPTQ